MRPPDKSGAMRERAERPYNPLPPHHARCLSISRAACLAFPDRFQPSAFRRDVVGRGVTALQFQGVMPNIPLKLAECVEMWAMSETGRISTGHARRRERTDAAS